MIIYTISLNYILLRGSNCILFAIYSDLSLIYIYYFLQFLIKNELFGNGFLRYKFLQWYIVHF